jgi:hypothetical protein
MMQRNMRPCFCVFSAALICSTPFSTSSET